MRTNALRWGWIVSLLVGMTGFGLPSAHAGPIEEFEKLESALSDAQEAFTAARHAAMEKDPRSANDVPDPRLPLLKKMDALADRTLGKPDGATIAVGAFAWSWNLDLDLEGLSRRFDRIVQYYPDDPQVEDILPTMGTIGSSVGKPEDWLRSLDRLAGKTKKKGVKLGAWLAMGDIYTAAGRAEDAKKAYRKVLDAAPADSDLATLAKGNLFELEHLQVGMVAPDFTTKTVDGRTISLKSLRGKVVLLDFWATWCGICVQEIPHLREAARKLKGKPFVILGVSLDYRREDLMRMLEHTDVPGIQTWDEAGVENPVGVLYNANALPKWFLIDPKGVIRARDPRAQDIPALVEKILKAKG